MTKRELSQLYYLDREITRESERLAQLEAAAASTTSAISGLPHTGIISDKTALAADIADSRAVIKNLIERSIQERDRLLRYIANIDDSRMRQIFKLKYIDHKKWNAIAMAMGGDNTADCVRKAHDRYLTRSM